MKSILRLSLAVLVLAGMSVAAELPDAPSVAVIPNSNFIVKSAIPAPTPQIAENKPVDAKFVSLALISTASTFADSYTTLWSTQNWQAGKTHVCNMEQQSPYLYGTHPTAARVYSVAAGKSAAAAFASYYMRKHHSRLWMLPMTVNAALSLEGVGQNMAMCN